MTEESPLKDADEAELRVLLDKEREKCRVAKNALDQIMRHYVSESKAERVPSDATINAMREIALAAIGLAQSVIEKDKP